MGVQRIPLADPVRLEEFHRIGNRLAAQRGLKLTALHNLVGITATKWTNSLKGNRALAFNEVARFAAAIGASGPDFDRLFELNDMQLELAGAARTGREGMQSAIQDLANGLAGFAQTRAHEGQESVIAHIYSVLPDVPFRDPPAALARLRELVLQIRGRQDEPAEYLRGLLYQIMAALEIREHWPSFDPGSNLMFSGRWKVPREGLELPAEARRVAGEAVARIAIGYLEKAKTEFVREGRSYEALFLSGSYVLLAAYSSIYGYDDGPSIVAALDRTFSDLGLGTAALGTAEQDE